MGDIEMQIENAWQESMKRGAELKYHVEKRIQNRRLNENELRLWGEWRGGGRA